MKFNDSLCNALRQLLYWLFSRTYRNVCFTYNHKKSFLFSFIAPLNGWPFFCGNLDVYHLHLTDKPTNKKSEKILHLLLLLILFSFHHLECPNFLLFEFAAENKENIWFSLVLQSSFEMAFHQSWCIINGLMKLKK